MFLSKFYSIYLLSKRCLNKPMFLWNSLIIRIKTKRYSLPFRCGLGSRAFFSPSTFFEFYDSHRKQSACEALYLIINLASWFARRFNAEIGEVYKLLFATRSEFELAAIKGNEKRGGPSKRRIIIGGSLLRWRFSCMHFFS